MRLRKSSTQKRMIKSTRKSFEQLVNTVQSVKLLIDRNWFVLPEVRRAMVWLLIFNKFSKKLVIHLTYANRPFNINRKSISWKRRRREERSSAVIPNENTPYPVWRDDNEVAQVISGRDEFWRVVKSLGRCVAGVSGARGKTLGNRRRPRRCRERK